MKYSIFVRLYRIIREASKRNVRVLVIMFRMIFFTLYLLIGVWYAYQITYIADSYICFGIAMAIMYVAYRVAVPFSKEVALEFGKYILYGLSYDDK